MLRARKHLDPNTCTLRVMALILFELTRRRSVPFEDIRKLVIRIAGDDAALSLVPAIEVIFLLGRVQYHEKTDTFEYISS